MSVIQIYCMHVFVDSMMNQDLVLLAVVMVDKCGMFKDFLEATLAKKNGKSTDELTPKGK